MRETREDFEKRKQEIDKYFSLLSILDMDEMKIHYKHFGKRKIQIIDLELLKILKANGYLLIYNLLESTCRNFLIAILTSIQNENLPLESLSEQTQLLWLKQKSKGMNDQTIQDKTLENRLRDVIKEIINQSTIEFKDIIAKAKIDGSDLFFNLSGNIDAENIRLIASTYGFNSKLTSDRERAGASLSDVRHMRNKLAHGRITFADCGKDCSVKQMIDYKDNAILYLEGILDNVDLYLSKQEFKNHHTTSPDLREFSGA